MRVGQSTLRFGVSNFSPFTPNSPLDAPPPLGAVPGSSIRPTLDSNRYRSLASQVYELDKPVGHGFGDVEFYLAALRDLSGPVLEPAVGSGRVLIPLLRAGLDVDGFDASPEMLAICRENCKAAGLTTRLSHARFEDFNCDREHAAIDVPAGSFQLITSFKAAIAVLERFHAHLTTGGLPIDRPERCQRDISSRPTSFGTGMTRPATSSRCTNHRRGWTTWRRSRRPTFGTTNGVMGPWSAPRPRSSRCGGGVLRSSAWRSDGQAPPQCAYTAITTLRCCRGPATKPSPSRRPARP